MSYEASARICPGDIVPFKFPYAEGGSPYARPCLVLEANTAEILLAYGTTSRGRANAGFEVRVTAEFRACGLKHASRFVLARRIRVRRDDPRFKANGDGELLLGALSEDLLSRQQVLMGLIAQTWNAPGLRYRAERAGIHPVQTRRRRRGGQLVSSL